MAIIDFEMPVLNGIEAIKEIRSTISNHNETAMTHFQTTELVLDKPKIIGLPTFAMFSQYSDPHFRGYCKERGVDFFIEKPPNENEIASLIIAAYSKTSKKPI